MAYLSCERTPHFISRNLVYSKQMKYIQQEKHKKAKRYPQLDWTISHAFPISLVHRQPPRTWQVLPPPSTSGPPPRFWISKSKKVLKKTPPGTGLPTSSALRGNAAWPELNVYQACSNRDNNNNGNKSIFNQYIFWRDCKRLNFTC